MLKNLKSYKYKLPTINGESKEHITNNNSVIIIGANGSGKSKLGAWIEGEDPLDVHRIAAQRNLNFQENIPLSNYDYAKNRIFLELIMNMTLKIKIRDLDGIMGKHIPLNF